MSDVSAHELARHEPRLSHLYAHPNVESPFAVPLRRRPAQLTAHAQHLRAVSDAEALRPW